ncbi:MAG: hypothetical protein GY909_01065 [Oligoflexia bacterium]|nr:hypothetical protein [Oligoflexia bacterium]
MKIFTFTIFILLSVLTHASSKSCYQTIKIDGQKVEEGPIEWRNLTTIEEKKSTAFYSLKDKKPLDTFLLVLFTGFSKPWYGYHSFVAFKDIGTWKVDKDHVSYIVDEDVYLEDNYRLKKVDHLLELEYEIKGSRFIGQVSYQSRHRGMSGKRTFELLKVECPE